MTTTYYVTANDITPSRCTVTGCYTRLSAAEAAVESDDMSGVFESTVIYTPRATITRVHAYTRTVGVASAHDTHVPIPGLPRGRKKGTLGPCAGQSHDRCAHVPPASGRVYRYMGA